LETFESGSGQGGTCCSEIPLGVEVEGCKVVEWMTPDGVVEVEDHWGNTIGDEERSNCFRNGGEATKYFERHVRGIWIIKPEYLEIEKPSFRHRNDTYVTRSLSRQSTTILVSFNSFMNSSLAHD